MRRRAWIPLVVIGVILLGILALESKSSGEYSITPGDATPVAPLIKISGVATNPSIPVESCWSTCISSPSRRGSCS